MCGEESFGTGSSHMREKDGLWAALMWLNILAVRKTSVAQILDQHWREFGRTYYTRHGYERIATDEAETLIQTLRYRIKTLVGGKLGHRTVETADEFC